MSIPYYLRFGVGVALAAVAAMPALGADLPSRRAPAAPLPVAPAFTWTGFYAGVNAGYAFADSKDSTFIGSAGYLGLAGAGAVPAGYSLDRDGFVIGGQLGYNYQVGAVVFGVEADIQYTDIKGTGVATGTGTPGLVTGRSVLELEYLGTVRGRIGFTPVDRLLLYVTGGLAYGEAKLNGTLTAGALPGGLAAASGAVWTGSRSQMKTGFAVGAGAEYAFTGNLTAKIEGLYYDLGDIKVSQPGVNAPGQVANTVGIFAVQKAELNGFIMRAGLNYKF